MPTIKTKTGLQEYVVSPSRVVTLADGTSFPVTGSVAKAAIQTAYSKGGVLDDAVKDFVLSLLQVGEGIEVTYENGKIQVGIKPPTKLIDNFTFTLKKAGTTSGGVYNIDTGQLVCTLWSARHFEEGTHIERWDHKDDFGNPLTGDFEARVLSSDIKYNWKVWANTSASDYGDDVHRPLDDISQIRITQHTDGRWICIYMSNYGESDLAEHYFYLDDPQRAYVFKKEYGGNQITSFVAINSTKIIRTVIDSYDEHNAKNFLFATDRSGKNFTEFSAGQYVKCDVGSEYNHAIGVFKEPIRASTSPSGLSANDDFIFLSRKGAINHIVVLDEDSGAVLSVTKIDKPSSVRVVGKYLWYVTNGTEVVKREVNANGSLGTITLTLKGFSSVVDIHEFGDNITIVDSGTSQQIKTYNINTGAHVWTRGKLGGYTGKGNKEVFDDKWFFNKNSMEEAGSIAFTPKGTYWLSDTGNNRLLHFDIKGKLIDSIYYLPKNYSVKINKNQDSFIISGYNVFEVDPTKPPRQAWKLKYNFLFPHGNDQLVPIRGFTTLSNRRMYGAMKYQIEGRPDAQLMVVELDPLVGVRQTKAIVNPQPFRTDQMYEDGSVRYIALTEANGVVTKQEWWKRELIGFDKDNDPLWGNDVKEEEFVIPPTGPIAGSPIDDAFCYKTDNGCMISYQASLSIKDAPNQYRLAGIKNGKAMFSTLRTVESNYRGVFPRNGEYDWTTFDKNDDGSPKGNHGNRVMTYRDHILAGAHCEFRQSGQTNMFYHVHESGLLISVVGEERPWYDRRGPVPYQAGNGFTPSLHRFSKDGKLRIVQGDESVRGGLQVSEIENFDSVEIQVGVPTTLPVAELPGINLLEGLKRGASVTGDVGRWSMDGLYYTDHNNKFITVLGSMTNDRYRNASTDIRSECIQPDGSPPKYAKCNLGTYAGLNSWNIKGMVEFTGNARNDPSLDSGLTIQVLDGAGLLIADLFYERERLDYFQTNWKGNGVIFKSYNEYGGPNPVGEAMDMHKVNHYQPLEIGASSKGVRFKYADFPELVVPVKDKKANWKEPRFLQVRFATAGTSYNRTISFDELRFHTT